MSALLGLDNVTWAECYALGGISLIAYAYRIEVYQHQQQRDRAENAEAGIKTDDEIMFEEFSEEFGSLYNPEGDAQVSDLWNMAEYAVESSKLAAIAAVLASSEISAAEYQGFHKKIGAKGGEKRAERLDPFKAFVMDVVRAQFGEQSAAKAAKSVLATLTEEQKCDDRGQAYQFSDEPDKTVARWIRNDRKSME